MTETDTGPAMVEYSYTGKFDHACLYSYVAGDTDAVRKACTSLLLDLQERDHRAVVWLDGKKFKLTAEEVESYKQRVAELFEKEKKLREETSAEDAIEEAFEEDAVEPEPDEDFDDLPPLMKL